VSRKGGKELWIIIDIGVENQHLEDRFYWLMESYLF
jgi:hypothetical protein